MISRMAGRISLEVARRQGALIPCDEWDDPRPPPRPMISQFSADTTRRVIRVSLKDLGLEEFAKGPGWVTHPRQTRRLMNYWSRGRGAAKIRWFMKGSMRRCIRQLRKYFPQNTGGLCANLHRRATGEWPRGGVIPS